MENKNILVGKIVAPQGVRGEVRVQTFSQNPTDFKTLRVFGANITSEMFKFVRVVPNSTVVIAKIAGIDDRNMAETLRGTELFIERGTLRNGQNIGTVDCFQNYGAGDIIEMDNGQMVSFVGATVDTENKIIYVK